MKKFICILLCVIAVLSFSSCSSENKNAAESTSANSTEATSESDTSSNSETNSNTTVSSGASQNSTAAENIISTKDFVPFSCSSDDEFSFFPKFGSVSYTADLETNNLVKKSGDSEENVLSFESDLRCCISVGSALYVSTDDAIYRLPVDENGDCDIKSMSVVIDGYSGMPAYCFENKMAVRIFGAHDDSYVMLDTQTGEYERTYDINVSVSENIAPSGSISSEEAAAVAMNKIKSKQFEGYFSRENYSKASSVTLIHYPDFYYGISGTIWEYGNRSEYVYQVDIIADGEDLAPKFTVYVDASNSEILFISFRKS